MRSKFWRISWRARIWAIARIYAKESRRSSRRFSFDPPVRKNSLGPTSAVPNLGNLTGSKNTSYDTPLHMNTHLRPILVIIAFISVPMNVAWARPDIHVGDQVEIRSEDSDSSTPTFEFIEVKSIDLAKRTAIISNRITTGTSVKVSEYETEELTVEFAAMSSAVSLKACQAFTPLMGPGGTSALEKIIVAGNPMVACHSHFETKDETDDLWTGDVPFGQMKLEQLDKSLTPPLHSSDDTTFFHWN
jgi:hypothetical protein